MAGNGRRAKALPDPRQTLRADDKIGGFDLPEGVLPNGEDWHPMTVEWWEAWRRSPQAAAMATDVDWHYLRDTALIHHTMWMKGRWEFANEIRMRVAKFGATPADRHALKFEIDTVDKFPVGRERGTRGHVSIMDAERRKRILNATY